MSIARMAIQEIWRRKTAFSLAASAVAVAVATMLGAAAALESYDRRAEAVLAQKQQELDQRLAALQDEMRKATLKLSFNLAILPAGQEVRQWHAEDYAEATMPEEYVTRLANSGTILVRHFLPTLSQKVLWPEMNRTIFLVGCRGEVPNPTKGPKPALVQPVPEGSMVVGYELHRSLGLQAGQKVKLMGREFVISRCNEERGSKDDIAVWIPLKDAQELLNQPGRINAILALECVCMGQTIIDQVRADIAKTLPGVKVVEFGTKALARSEARARVAQEAQAELEREKRRQAELAAERRRLARWITPGVAAACAGWILLMALVNARQRRPEMAILRAVGYSAGQILSLLLARALASGVLGAALGGAAGVAVARSLGADLGAPPVGPEGLLSWSFLAAAAALGALLSLAAAWIPALIAAQQDPANILRET